jgi:hypothetical protein
VVRNHTHSSLVTRMANRMTQELDSIDFGDFSVGVYSTINDHYCLKRVFLQLVPAHPENG